MLKGKKIVLGITGSIAAYKACLIVRLLMKQGAEVQVVITDAGKQFITPVTLSALTGKPVVSEFFTANDGTTLDYGPMPCLLRPALLVRWVRWFTALLITCLSPLISR